MTIYSPILNTKVVVTGVISKRNTRFVYLMSVAQIIVFINHNCLFLPISLSIKPPHIRHFFNAIAYLFGKNKLGLLYLPYQQILAQNTE